MPKKFKGENSKAVEAKLRKAAVREAEEEKKVKDAEDAYWQDDDKHAQRKQQRKDDKDKKRIEALERKKESQEMLEQETSALKSAKPPPASKLTRADITANRDRMAVEAAAEGKPEMHHEAPLEENVNQIEGAEGDARNVDEAIGVLSLKEPTLDRHPEKRVKAAFQEYEDRNLPILKAENPNLRLSQLKQMLKKDWMKSPENPLNQRHQVFNTKK